LIKANKFEILDCEGLCTNELKGLSIEHYSLKTASSIRQIASGVAQPAWMPAKEPERIGYRMFIGVNYFYHKLNGYVIPESKFLFSKNLLCTYGPTFEPTHFSSLINVAVTNLKHKTDTLFSGPQNCSNG
jgi:hypothetical protein